MKIGIVGIGRELMVKKLLELTSTSSQNKCVDCNYEFNNDYESKCPLCGSKVKR